MVRIESLSDFVQRIAANGKNTYSKLNDLNSVQRHFYRGHSDCKYELLPSIARENITRKSNINLEFQMIRRAKLRNPNELSNIDNQINLLAKLQHYGLETRLLDLTENALVALYFACIDSNDQDGEVIIFEVDSDKIKDPYTLTARFYSQFSKSVAMNHHVDNFINAFVNDNENQDIIKLIVAAAEDRFKSIIKTAVLTEIDMPIVLNHAIHSEREIRQQAAFLLFPNKYYEKSGFFNSEIVPLNKNHRLIKERVIIPKELKKQLIEELKLFGISDEFIFPEFNNRCKAINNEIGKIVADNTDFSNNFINKIMIESINNS